MGNRKSKPRQPIVYPPLDTLFEALGCIGMTRKEYDTPRLDLAPFLYYRIKETTYGGLVAKIIDIFRTLPPMDGQPPPQASSPADLAVEIKRVYGPVYLFAAYDPEQKQIECYLYFPSMTKDGKKWTSYHFLGITHNWMHRLIYGPAYTITRPNTNCSMRMPDNTSMQFGCRTESSYGCVQSKKAHKMMRIYKRKKNIAEYPASYFRVYQLKLSDPRISQYVVDQPMTKLQRNILPGDVEMFAGCRYMLVSPNNQYFMVLGKSWLCIFRNIGNENIEALCLSNRNPTMALPVRMLRFPGFLGTYMILENTTLNIYSDIGDNEEIVFANNIVKQGAKGPFALVLQDDGSLIVYDSSNQVASDGSLVTNSVFDERRAKGSSYGDEYDPVADYRRRIINLIAYLRMYGLYKEIQSQSKNVDPQVALYVLQDGIPPYDAKADYVQRLESLVRYLINKGYSNLIHTAITSNTSNVTDTNKQNINTDTTIPEIPSDIQYSTRPDGPTVNVPSNQSPNKWQTPNAIDTNADADANNCEGLEDEALADCIDKAEQATAEQEANADKALEDKEYAIIDSDDPLAGVAVIDDTSATSAPLGDQNTVWTEKDYQQAIAICRSMKDEFHPKTDVFCRLAAMKEYMRRRGIRVVNLQKRQDIDTSNKTLDGSIADYDQPTDFALRLKAIKDLLASKTQ